MQRRGRARGLPEPRERAAPMRRGIGGRPVTGLAGLVTLWCLFPAAVQAQTPLSPSQQERVRRVHAAVEATARHLGDRLWPGFRPWEDPVLYTGLGGGVLLNWSGGPPPGFDEMERLEGATWSASPDFAALMTRPTAFTSLDSSYSLPVATALAVHEHFHAHQRTAVRRGDAFGRGERPADVRYYPALDANNGSLLELEGRLLQEALRAQSDVATAERVAEFLSVRDRRRSELDSVSALWERGAERNEGLADYVALRALRWIAESDYGGWGAAAAAEIERRLSRLARLSEVVGSSLRRVFYVTGSAQALLLDRLTPGWKERMVVEGGTPEALLAGAVGYEDRDASHLFRRAARREDLSTVRRRVARAVTGLAARRRAVADSVLAGPGLLLALHADDSGTVCGLDPLNLLHVGDGRVIHAGFVRVCAEDGRYSASFTTDVVEDVDTRTFVLRAGASEGIELSADGRELAVASLEVPATLGSLRVEGAGMLLEATRARVRKTGRRLVVEPLP